MSILELKNVHKSYVQGSKTVGVLKGVNFSITPGETVAIVGHSGAGKSTLLSVMSGLDRVDDGSIQLAGADITHASEDELSRARADSLGIVFQQFHLMHSLTALENVALPMEIKGYGGREEAAQALEEVGLGLRKDHYPGQLSGGECQRVAIARAIVTKPKLLLADEPSGNLDTETGEQVMSALFSLVASHGMTMVLVTHDLDLARRCQRVLKLVGGILAGDT